jgi:hypothetical protein
MTKYRVAGLNNGKWVIQESTTEHEFSKRSQVIVAKGWSLCSGPHETKEQYLKIAIANKEFQETNMIEEIIEVCL